MHIWGYIISMYICIYSDGQNNRATFLLSVNLIKFFGILQRERERKLLGI